MANHVDLALSVGADCCGGDGFGRRGSPVGAAVPVGDGRPPHRRTRGDLVGTGPADLRVRPRVPTRVTDVGGVGTDRSARRRRDPRQHRTDADRRGRGVRSTGPHRPATIEGGGMTVVATDAAETAWVETRMDGMDPDTDVGF